MKKALFLLILVNYNILAGELSWTVNNKYYSFSNCSILSQAQSDLNNISKYWLDCGDNTISPFVNGGSYSRTVIYLEGSLSLICMAETIIYSKDDFYINLDCEDTIFKSSFD